MTRVVATSLMMATVVTALAAQGGVPPPPPQDGIPGRAAQNRVFILNRDKRDAVPVAIVTADPVPITVTGVPVVQVDSTTAPVRGVAVRQQWDYRTVTVAVGTDPQATLASAGNDGWELVGIVPTAASSHQFVLKRPR